MREILLPIHPEYVDRILSGEKRFEYRRKTPRSGVSHILIYATSPAMEYKAAAEVVETLTGPPSEIWGLTSLHGGISEDRFEAYFRDRSTAIAYRLGRVWRLPEQNFYFPKVQSFLYLPEGFVERLTENLKPVMEP
ncbi:MAG: ASCH domain-containing protein [Clostridia bacterium]|nr:ASCH domain-containing protein [Clostridia bacterium]